LSRTEEWDEFPNGRWGDGRSPAFGELSNYHWVKTFMGSKEDRRGGGWVVVLPAVVVVSVLLLEVVVVLEVVVGGGGGGDR